MIKRSYVKQANELVQQGYVPEAYRVLMDGLDHYQRRIVKMVSPYPTADAALLAVTLRNMADCICKDYPDCAGLMEEINSKFKAPEFSKKKGR